jgi:hypothetical protein
MGSSTAATLVGWVGAGVAGMAVAVGAAVGTSAVAIGVGVGAGVGAGVGVGVDVGEGSAVGDENADNDGVTDGASPASSVSRRPFMAFANATPAARAPTATAAVTAARIRDPAIHAQAALTWFIKLPVRPVVRQVRS